jgi:hypothetical protein
VSVLHLQQGVSYSFFLNFCFQFSSAESPLIWIERLQVEFRFFEIKGRGFKKAPALPFWHQKIFFSNLKFCIAFYVNACYNKYTIAFLKSFFGGT